MKEKSIRFFSPQENSEKVEKKITAQPKPTGSISPAGKLILPLKTIEQLNIDPATTLFKIGTEQGKRKLKLLYLIPASSDQSETFELVRSGRGYVIPLGLILKKGGVDFSNNKYTFTISSFDYEGSVGYELVLNDSVVKPEYTGKPRGRKKKVEEIA